MNGDVSFLILVFYVVVLIGALLGAVLILQSRGG
jgi:hypothetical protein